MKDTLSPGLTHTMRFTMPDNRTAPHLRPESPAFATMPEVLTTGLMVGIVEWARVEADGRFETRIARQEEEARP